MGLSLYLYKIRRLSDAEFDELKKRVHEYGAWNDKTWELGNVVDADEREFPENAHLVQFMRPFSVKKTWYCTFHCELIGYWRKEYALMKKIDDLCGGIEDQEYIPCTKEMLDAILEYGGEYLEKDKIACSDGEELFFCASY